VGIINSAGGRLKDAVLFGGGGPQRREFAAQYLQLNLVLSNRILKGRISPAVPLKTYPNSASSEASDEAGQRKCAEHPAKPASPAEHYIGGEVSADEKQSAGAADDPKEQR
jgi:hypothetical protein